MDEYGGLTEILQPTDSISQSFLAFTTTPGSWLDEDGGAGPDRAAKRILLRDATVSDW